MGKIKLQTCYLVIDVKEKFPPEGELVSISMDNGKTFPYEAKFKPIFKDELGYSHWLEKQEAMVVLTKEEFEKIALGLWKAGENLQDEVRDGKPGNALLFEQYLKRLFEGLPKDCQSKEDGICRLPIGSCVQCDR